MSLNQQTQTSVRTRKSFEVLVIKDRCKECGLCIKLCPPKVLASESTYNRFGYRPTYIIDNSKCIGCKICEFVCPEFAIFVREVG
ncbi:MAG: 4Fe-4S dicluster domain-containing protein [Nitrososphaeria archaeon]